MPTPRSSDTDKRSKERKQAERMYLESKGNMKLVEIAEKLGLPDNKVRKWKSLDNWEGKLHPTKADNSKKKTVERSTKEKWNVPPKRGAPKGNTNAKGNKGNPNPVKPPDQTKHGGYSSVYWDVLDEEELGLIDDIPKDEEDLLIEQIQLFSVRERRIMQAINKYRNMDGPVAIVNTWRGERKRTFDTPEDEAEYNRLVREKIDKGERMPGKEYQTQTSTDNKDNIIARLESELSNVQAKKTKAIEALSRIHLEKAKLEGDSKGNDIVKSWADKVLKARREQGNE